MKVFRLLPALLAALLLAASPALGVFFSGSRYTILDDARKAQLGDAVLTYQGAALSETDLTTYTFAAAAIGTASADRYVIVSSTIRVGAPVATLTVGGVSATSIVALTSGSNEVSFWVALVPTGTTGDIVVTTSGATVRCFVSWWTVTNLSSTAYTATINDQTMSAGVMTADLSAIPAGGFALATTMNGGGAGTYVWNAGLTERNDQASSTSTASSASDSFAALQGTTTLTTTYSGGGAGTNPILLAIAMR